MPRIFGQRIILREYKKEDLSFMREWVNDPEVVNNLSDIFLFPHTVEVTEKFLDAVLQNDNVNTIHFVIALKENEEYIGQLDIIHIDHKNRVAEIGIVIGRKENWGKGYGSEAIKLIQYFVFDRLNMNRLEIKVDAYNERAYKCYLKSGFKEEGRLRQKFYKDGKYSDYIYLSIIEEEYRKGK